MEFNFKIIDMYSLNCDYFVEEFSSIEELINYVTIRKIGVRLCYRTI
jgi:hypothetical protein